MTTTTTTTTGKGKDKVTTTTTTTEDVLTYLHTDHLGTPRIGTDASGQIVWRWDGDAFGTTAASEDPDGDGKAVNVNLRFAGQYFDTETNLHYNYFRYYDPQTGRYITSDPIGLLGGLNTYTYVLNNPLKYIDPLGLEAACSSFITCSSAPVTTLVLCTQTNTCVDDDGNISNDRLFEWYVWPDRDFNFMRFFEKDDFPGELPQSPTIFPDPFKTPEPSNPVCNGPAA